MSQTRGIYIFRSGPHSGKSVVLVGIMELLSRRILEEYNFLESECDVIVCLGP